MPHLRKFLKKIKIPAAIAGLFFTLLLLFFWKSMVITILPGEKGVFYSRFFGGTDLEMVYGEGLHLIFPWNKMYVYNTRIQQLTLPLTLLNQDGLQIKLTISIRYQVMKELLPQLQVLVGPNYLDTIIIPSVTSAVRQTLGEYRPDELYSTARQELQDQILVEAVTEISRVPINLHNVIVKGLALPDSLNTAIDKKLVAEQDYLRYQFLLKAAVQEAKRKTIEGYGIAKYQELINSKMTNNFLRFEGIKATRELAASTNAKLVVVGGGKDGMPLILNAAETAGQASHPAPPVNMEPKPAPQNNEHATQQQRVEQSSGHNKTPREEIVQPLDLKGLMKRLKYYDQLLLNPDRP